MLNLNRGVLEGKRIALLEQFGTSMRDWEACENPNWMLWILDKLQLAEERVLWVFTFRCIHETPTGPGQTLWDRVGDSKIRHAVDSTQQYALDGDYTSTRRVAYLEALPAIREAYWHPTEELVRQVMWTTLAWIAMDTAAWVTANAVSRAVARIAEGDVRKFQCNMLRGMVQL